VIFVQNFDPVQAAYVHIPFCRRRCYYCDFPVAIVGDRRRGEASGTIARYLDFLCQEISLTPKMGLPLTTIFLGGGTPSLLSPRQLQRVLDALSAQFGRSVCAEVSIEMDPGTFDQEQIRAYRNCGINRVSLGAQAFQPELLSLCGRSHAVADIYAAVDDLRQADIKNFSLDLISGLPTQTLTQWQASLDEVVAIAPPHISVYDLIVEPVTAFGRRYKPGLEPLPPEDTTAEMYRLAQQTLTAAGYHHYEISNYAKPGFECRHNRVYWENRPFYGFGMGAASYQSGQRVTRPRTTQDYYQWVKEMTECARSPRHSSSESQDLASRSALRDALLEVIMLGLRLAEGLHLDRLVPQFGSDWITPLHQCLEPYIQCGWVEWNPIPEASSASSTRSTKTAVQLRLTDPEGFLFSNTVLSKVFACLGPD